MRFVAVQTYAGGFDVGAVQAGLQLVGKLENKGGFGIRQCEANRRVLGDDWESQVADPDNWVPINAEIITSNPPCSVWSSMTFGTIDRDRGSEHPISDCMRHSINYAGRVKPLIYIMESVQGAPVKGMSFMRRLRAKLEEMTGDSYWLYHVLQNNGALGGASIRRRYFLVLSRIPFGVELPTYDPPPTLFETIGDLESLDYRTWGPQRLTSPASSWVTKEVLSDSGTVDGHVTAKWETPGMLRLMDLLAGDTDEIKIWPENACLTAALRNYYAAYGKLPDSWHFKGRDGKWADEALLAKNFEMGFTRPKRWVYDKPSYVVIGGAMYLVLHPVQPRMLTHRECARIMGFPDDWVVEPLRGLRGLEEGWGKGVSVQSGRWIAEWARLAVEGEPGSYVGVPVVEHHRLKHHGHCERETVIDVSRVPKQAVLPVNDKPMAAAEVAA